MNTVTSHRIGLAGTVAALAALVAIPFAFAAPTATPPSDSQGYIDSTARCTKPDTAVIFGTTETSRVAICQAAGGDYQYRGVRVRDGAKLIVAAEKTSDGAFVADNEGVTYTVTTKALTVSLGDETLRSESWTDFNGPQAPASSTGTSAGSATTSATTSATNSATTSSAASTPASTSASTSASGATSAPASTSASAAAPKSSAAPSRSSTPLPPPLPAEVGGS